jgi:hypothetical protein
MVVQNQLLPEDMGGGGGGRGGGQGGVRGVEEEAELVKAPGVCVCVCVCVCVRACVCFEIANSIRTCKRYSDLGFGFKLGF